jgi:drug/metabolite transporter (DMT)-like permease
MSLKYYMMGTIQLAAAVAESSARGETITALVAQARRSWKSVAVPTAFMLVTQGGFTTGLLETTAANAIMLFSLNPLWAALMGRVFLKDPVEKHTVVVMAIAFLAVALAFVPSVLWPEGREGAEGSEGASQPTLHGDLVSLATGVTLAAFITGSRAGSLNDPFAPMGIAPALGSLGASLIATPVALSFMPSFDAHVFSPMFLAYIFIDAVLEAFYDVWMGQAAEHITSAEVALVLLLEIPLGPLFVFFSFREVPPWYTMIGCVVLLITLVTHGVMEARVADARSRSPVPRSPPSAVRRPMASPTVSSSDLRLIL